MRIYLVNEFRKRIKEAFWYLCIGEEVYIKRRDEYYKITFPGDLTKIKEFYENDRRAKKAERRIKSSEVSSIESVGKDTITGSQ